MPRIGKAPLFFSLFPFSLLSGILVLFLLYAINCSLFTSLKMKGIFLQLGGIMNWNFYCICSWEGRLPLKLRESDNAHLCLPITELSSQYNDIALTVMIRGLRISLMINLMMKCSYFRLKLEIIRLKTCEIATVGQDWP